MTQRGLWSNVIALIVVTVLEVVFYPYIAEGIYRLVGGKGGAGSSIGYFRDVYVAGAAAAFLLILIVGAWAASRAGRLGSKTLIGAWIANAGLLIASALWYFHAIRAASEYRG